MKDINRTIAELILSSIIEECQKEGLSLSEVKDMLKDEDSFNDVLLDKLNKVQSHIPEVVKQWF